MSPTKFSTDIPIPDVRPAAMERRRLREAWMFSVPMLIIIVALYHLATCWNSPQPTLMAIRPHRTIHVVPAGQQVPTSPKESRSESSLESDEERAFDPTAVPAPWPYGAGWR